MNRFSFSIATAVALAVLPSHVQAQQHGKVPARRPRPHPAAGATVPMSTPGSPLQGLTSDQLAAYLAGLEEFQNVEASDTGLGPIFNNVSCVACHSAPAVGGASTITVTRFGKTENGVFDPLAELGGSLLQDKAIDSGALETVPLFPIANVVAKRQSTPLFGLGLIEAIPDDAIRQNALRPKRDGVRGRVSIVADVANNGQQRVGKFGWKAQQATLLAFAGDAYLNEMGITNRFFPDENAPNGDKSLLATYDKVEDPEDSVDPATGESDIDHAADFMRLLAPLQPKPPTPSSMRGSDVFNQIGCASCHQPTMATGFNKIQALSGRIVPLYSDLLLHNMGSLGDGIAQGTAGPREMKTAPLWGLRATGPYLHDGRAATVDEAIRAHDGEAAVARDRYKQLPPIPRQQLIEFLNSI